MHYLNDPSYSIHFHTTQQIKSSRDLPLSPSTGNGKDFRPSRSAGGPRGDRQQTAECSCTRPISDAISATFFILGHSTNSAIADIRDIDIRHVEIAMFSIIYFFIYLQINDKTPDKIRVSNVLYGVLVLCCCLNAVWEGGWRGEKGRISPLNEESRKGRFCDNC